MFYSRPALVPHTKKIIIGLPPKRPCIFALSCGGSIAEASEDVLNRFYPSWHPKRGPGSDSLVDPDTRQQMEQARNLAKYVFPRQYGLSHAFTACGTGHTRQPDYLDRELEIKLKGSCKTPKRLKDVLRTLEKMIWRHHKCRYKSLLDLACPSKLKKNDDTPLDSSVILVEPYPTGQLCTTKTMLPCRN
ncbi:hypothetical protein BC628DRAFT_1406548 [Trametes gibbosa]|nr:hypothetical protein BC628DRAFT_1406548 [Trametes gibbosa]